MLVQSQDQDHYLERKKLYEERVQNMIRYVSMTDTCRSRYIANYFGDTELEDCGSCDNCLAKKRKTLSSEEFTLIETFVIQSLGSQLQVNELLNRLKKYNKEKIWTVLDFLQSEQSISIDEQGFIQKKA